MRADRFLAIPFVARGRDYDGADCWGLVALYYRDVLGIALTSYAETPPHALRDVAALIAAHKREWALVSVPRAGDVALMRIRGRQSSSLVAHVGVMIDRRRVLHTEDGPGARLEPIGAPHVAPRILEYRRHRQMEAT